MQVLNYNEVFQNCSEDLSRTHAYIRLQEMRYGSVEIENEEYIEFDTNGRLGTLERASFPHRFISRLKNRSQRPEIGLRNQLAKKFRTKARNAVDVIFRTRSSQSGTKDPGRKSTTPTAGNGAREEHLCVDTSKSSAPLSHTKASFGQESEIISKSTEAVPVHDSSELVGATIPPLSLINKEAQLYGLEDTGEGDCKRVKCRLPSEEQAPHVQPGFVARAINSFTPRGTVETETAPKGLKEGQVQVSRKGSSQVEKDLLVAHSDRHEGGHIKEQASRVEPGFVARAIHSLASCGLVELESDLLRMKEAKLQVPEIQVSETERNTVYVEELDLHERAHQRNIGGQSVRSESPVSLFEEDISCPSTLIQNEQSIASKVSYKNTPGDDFKLGYVARVVDSLNYYIDHERCESPPVFRSTGALFSVVSK